MSFLRLTLPVLLALATSGVPGLLTTGAAPCAEEGEAGCADEEGCCDCAPTCSGCVCCPLRTAMTSALPVAPSGAPRQEPVRSGYHQVAVAMPGCDIFHPPRA
ncbi:MAG: hypothetical protein ACYC8T_39515 [Myxococcaceae bacterium]